LAKPAPRASELPKRWPWLIRGFTRYVGRFLRKNFHAVRLSKSGAVVPADGSPLLVVLNHPSWWDPMVGTALSDLLPTYAHYAAIDAAMLKVYRVFSRLGFFGIDMESLNGARTFLQTGTAILSHDRHAVWVTAQGRFADVRLRPLGLKPGVGHLAARLERGWVVPVALEYAFWNARRPEALVRIGKPMPLGEGGPSREWSVRIEAALAETLDRLNTEAMTRDESLFTTLIGK
jgi:1-acyl-sn-glycerol-3-phosphate acyltransferase